MVACDSARGSSATLSREGRNPSAADRPTLWNLERRTIERETRYLYAYSMKLLRDPDLASACCLGPLVLVALGFSGAWIGNLTMLEPYRPLFIGAALVALFFAWRSIFRPVQACKPGEVCAASQVRTAYKVVFWIVAAPVLVALAFPYVLPLFY